MQLIVSKTSISKISFVFLCSAAVFLRFLFAGRDFSLDYSGYLFIFDRLSELSFEGMLGENFIFPYVIADRIVPIEIGFSLLVKVMSVFTGSPETIFAVLASASVGLRMFTMDSLRVPRHWSLFLNVILVTLFEANALRLGIASSLLLFGLYCLLQFRLIVGYAAIAIAITFHLQIVIFVAPFLVFFIFSNWIIRSRLRIWFLLSAFCLSSFVFSKILPFLGNSKIDEYSVLKWGGGEGFTVTSVLAIFLLIFSALATRKRDLRDRNFKFWIAVLAATVPSVVLLLVLTDLAVVGARAWQLAFAVMATFFLTEWATFSQKIIPYVFFILLTFTIFINVMVRYPLSNFLSPPFPAVQAFGRF